MFPISSTEVGTFGEWFQIGFAFSLPLIVFGFIALFLFFWMAAKGP